MYAYNMHTNVVYGRRLTNMVAASGIASIHTNRKNVRKRRADAKKISVFKAVDPAVQSERVQNSNKPSRGSIFVARGGISRHARPAARGERRPPRE